MGSNVVAAAMSSSSAVKANRRTPDAPRGVALRADAQAGQVWKRFPMRSPRLTLGEGPARPRSARFRGPVLDAVGAGLLWSVMAVELAERPLAPGQSASTVVAYLLAGAICAPFAVHRRFPVAAIVVSDLALAVYAIGRFSAFPGYAIFALVFGVGLHVGRVRAVVVYLAGVVGLIVALALQPAGVATASSWISTVLTVTVAWLAGEHLRSLRARRQLELEEAQRLVQQRADEGRRAVSEERLRIARDLHDVVAHSMSVIAVQAGVANHVIDERPELVRQALGTIEVTARQGLVEMRRLLGVLRSERSDADGTGSRPAEGLRDLDRLLEQFRAAGLRLEVKHLAEISDLPAALDISAYRIVQEGLTNVLRHGGPVAQLTISRSEAALQIEIRDEGRPRGSAALGSARLRPRPHRDPRASRAVRRNVTSGAGAPRRIPSLGRAADRTGGRVAMIRVAVVDDQALLRAGFGVLLESATDIDIVGSAANGAEAIDLVLHTQPDVVLMDIRMPVMDGLEATRRILADDRCVGVRVLILTTFDLDEYVFAALRAGASGFMLKDTPPAELLAGVRLVADR